jgi:hypothetical protein
MRIVYVGPFLEVDLNGVVCKYGEAVAFPDDIARSVVGQEHWTTADDSSAPKLDKETGEYVRSEDTVAAPSEPAAPVAPPVDTKATDAAAHVAPPVDTKATDAATKKEGI